MNFLGGLDSIDFSKLRLNGLGAAEEALSQAEAFKLLRPLIPQSVDGVFFGKNYCTDDHVRDIISRVYSKYVIAKTKLSPSNPDKIASDVKNIVMLVLGSAAMSYADKVQQAVDILTLRGYVVIPASELGGSAQAPAATRTPAVVVAPAQTQAHSYDEVTSLYNTLLRTEAASLPEMHTVYSAITAGRYDSAYSILQSVKAWLDARKKAPATATPRLTAPETPVSKVVEAPAPPAARPAAKTVAPPPEALPSQQPRTITTSWQRASGVMFPSKTNWPLIVGAVCVIGFGLWMWGRKGK